MTRDEKAKLDRLVDRALAECSKAEPRSGLELRVLANLRAERRRMAEQRRRWWWTVGIAVTAAVLVIGLWAGRNARRHDEQEASVKPSPAVSAADANVAQQASQDTSRKSGPDVAQESVSQTPQPTAISRHHRLQQAKRRIHRRHVPRVLRADKRERGQQFPSPTPLNEQERILQVYVQQYKNDAILTARAQAELAKKEEREIAGTSTNSDESSEKDKP